MGLSPGILKNVNWHLTLSLKKKYSVYKITLAYRYLTKILKINGICWYSLLWISSEIALGPTLLGTLLRNLKILEEIY